MENKKKKKKLVSNVLDSTNEVKSEIVKLENSEPHYYHVSCVTL